MSDDNRRIVDDVNAAFAAGDTEGFLSLCSDDFVMTMVGNGTFRGKDEIRAWMSAGLGDPPRFTVDTVITTDDRAVAYGDMTMKEADGSSGSYAYCDVYRFANGKVKELRAFVVRTDSAK